MNVRMKRTILEGVALILCLLVLIPFYMFFVNSLKTENDAAFMSLSLPKVFQFQNFVDVFKEAHMLNAFKNSVIVSTTTVGFIVIICSMAGYIIQRKHTKISEAIYKIFLLGLIIPGFIIPTYLLASDLGLIGSLWGMILVSVTGSIPVTVFLYTGFFKTVPRDIDESAIIDGCSPFGLFVKIVIPLLKPVTATVIIINFIGIWNDFGTALYFLNTEAKYTIVMTTFYFYRTYTGEWNHIFANLVIICVPVLIVYFFLQRYIISGMTGGSVKG